MGKQVIGTKTTPVAGDTLIIKDSEDSGNLKEIDFDNIRVASVALTDTTGKVKTYTLYSDIGATNAIGTIVVTDGNDGAGNTIGLYGAGTTYAADAMSISANGSLVRSLADNNIGNTPPTISNDANWAIVHNSIKVRILTAGENIIDGVTYFCDTSGGGFTIDVVAGVNLFFVRDLDNTWSDANPLIVDVGADTFNFGESESGGVYTFVRSGNTFRAYDINNAVSVGNI